MREDPFNNSYNRLNQFQKQAVDTIDGPVMVIAGPGTGKTTVLTLRIANILKKTDIPPDAILALTFTESGVRSMRMKLADIIGVRAYDVRIHTFHSFANELIKTYPDRFPRILGAEHMEELEQRHIMQEAIDGSGAVILRPRNDPGYYIRHASGAIQELKRENVNPKQFKELVKKQKEALKNDEDAIHAKGRFKGEVKGSHLLAIEKMKKNEELVKVYEVYEKILEQKRLYDFDDMLMEVIRTFEKDKDLLLRLQEEAQYILADEHQDANNAQNRMLELLSSFHEDPNIFIVGDEKQAIFRFQGASLENFLYFKRLFKNAKVIFLEENYRSHQTLLDASHGLMSQSETYQSEFLKPLLARAGHIPKKIRIITSSTKESERIFIAEEISKLLKNGLKPKEIAVLIRENKDAEPLERALIKEGIPVARFAGADALSHPRIDRFVKFLEAVVVPSDENIGRMLFLDFLHIEPHEAFVFLEEVRKEKAPLARVLSKNATFAELSRNLSRWTSVANNELLVSGFNLIVHESGFRDYLVSLAGAHELLELFEALLRAVERFAEREKKATLSDFLTHLKQSEKHGLSLNVEVSAPHGVNIMTAHRSKGLEFDAVFIVHGVDGVWGGKRKRSLIDLPRPLGGEEHETDDERRLFYVALTRARKDAYISYYLQGTDSRERSPSRFIAEIASEHKEEETVTTKAPESKPFVRSPKLFEDKTYLNALFLERGLSVTHLNNYLECPWRYFFVDLIRIPQSQEGPLLYGNACHSALKAYFDAYARDEDISIPTTLGLFENFLRRTHLSGHDLNSYLTAGKKELKGYLNQKNFSRNIFNEYRVRGIPIEIDSHETILLNGSLDKVELLSGQNVNVVDYKTGRSKSRNEIEGKNKNSDGNYKRQLVFYKILLDGHGKWNMKTGELDFLKPDDKGKYRREVFEIESVEADELKIQIKKIAEEILALSFSERACLKEDCEYCRLAESV